MRVWCSGGGDYGVATMVDRQLLWFWVSFFSFLFFFFFVGGCWGVWWWWGGGCLGGFWWSLGWDWWLGFSGEFFCYGVWFWDGDWLWRCGNFGGGKLVFVPEFWWKLESGCVGLLEKEIEGVSCRFWECKIEFFCILKHYFIYFTNSFYNLPYIIIFIFTYNPKK